MVLERLDQPSGRRPADDARAPRATVASAWRTAATRGSAVASRHSTTYATLADAPPPLLRLVRHGQPRPAARGHHRRRREHAARRSRARSSSTCRSTSCATSPSTPKQAHPPADDRGCLPARERELAVRGSENPNLMPDAQHHRPVPFVGGWGGHHHREEPGDDAVRSARVPHQGEPEVRIGEEGTADHLLPVGRARADPRQLRVLLRRRRALVPTPTSSTTPTPWPASRTAACSSSRASRGLAEEGLGDRIPAGVSGRSSSTSRSGCSPSTASRSPARKRRTPTSSSACRASPSRVRSSPHRRSWRRPAWTSSSCSARSDSQLRHKFGAQGRPRRRQTTCAWSSGGFDESATDPRRRQVGRGRHAERAHEIDAEPPMPVHGRDGSRSSNRSRHRHPPLLGADRQLLRPRHGERQPDRSLHRAGCDAGHARRSSAT